MGDHVGYGIRPLETSCDAGDRFNEAHENCLFTPCVGHGDAVGHFYTPLIKICLKLVHVQESCRKCKYRILPLEACLPVLSVYH